MKGILFVDTSPRFGEEQRSLCTLINHLNPSRYQAFILSADNSETGLLSKFERGKSIPTRFIELRGWQYDSESLWTIFLDRIDFRSEISKLIREYQIDVIYANAFYAGLLCTYSIPGDMPLLFRHSDYHCRSSTLSKIINRANKSLVVSDFLRNHWIKRLNLTHGTAEKMKTVYNGFDLEEISQVRGEYSFRESYTWGSESTLVFINADMIPEKRHELFLRAFAIARQKNDTLFALISGKPLDADGYDYLEKLFDLAWDLGILFNVAFMEHVENNLHILDASDMVVSVAENEVWGASIVYALACGKPLVMTKGGGPEELASAYEGSLAVSDEPEKIAEAILDRAAVKGNNFTEQSKQILADYTIEKQLNIMQDIVDQIA